MTFPYQSIQDADVDVAAAVHENFLNNFSKGHFKSVPQLYLGKVVFDNFQSRVSVGYEIQEALTFDLTPIPTSKIRKVLVSHFTDVKKSTNAEQYLDAFAPPNIEVSGKKVKVTITVYKGHTNDVDFAVDFNWAVAARCLIYFKEYTPVKKAIRLEVLRVAFTKPAAELEREIKEKLKKLGSNSSRSAKDGKLATRSAHALLPRIPGAQGDPEWCTKLEKLFLFLVNQVLAVQFTNFVNEWELPRAIEVAEGASITPSLLAVTDNYLIVGAHVNFAIDRAFTEMQAVTTHLLEGFSEEYRKEFSGITDDAIKSWKPAQSRSLNWLSEQAKEARKASDHAGGKSSKKAYDKSLIVLSNAKLFDAIAKANLKASGAFEAGTGIDNLVKIELGWAFGLGPSSAKIISGGIEVDTSAQVQGYVRGCLPDLNPKHWGDWACQGICIRLSTNSKFGVQARPSFEDDGVYCRFSLKPGSSIAFNFCDLPSWLSDLEEWASSQFTSALLSVLSIVVSRFKFQILSYPDQFPGTGLHWKSRMNSTISNQLSYLEISGDPTFT